MASNWPAAQDNDTTLGRYISTDAVVPNCFNNYTDAIEAMQATLQPVLGAPSGTAGQVLAINDPTTPSYSWVTPGGGGGGGLILLEHTTLVAEASYTFDVSAYPAARAFRLFGQVIGTASAQTLVAVLNADAVSANYPAVYLRASVGAGVSSGNFSVAGANIGFGSFAGSPCVISVEFPNPVLGAQVRGYLAKVQIIDSSGSMNVFDIAGAWQNTAAITSLQVMLLGGASLQVGSVLTLEVVQ